MGKNGNLKEIVSGILIPLIAIPSLYFMIQMECNEGKVRTKLYNELKISADTDENGFVCDKEWNKVYSFVGKDYNLNFSNPKVDLEIEDMRKFLGRN